ncbi:MAG: ABC transporter ATP-binding protein/permease [Bacilli bacterium]|nr:ABC transporter ATP-binding protein/permease [Bacilli bacterium]
MLKIFKHLSKRDIAFLIIAIGLIVLQVYLDLTIPDYTAKLTESIAEQDKNEVWINGGIMLGLAFASMCAAIATGYFSSHIAANFSRTLRSKLYDQIASFSDAEMNKFSTPSLITRTTNDVVNMQMFIALGMQVLIKAPILAIWAVCKISSTSIEWTMAVLICVLVIIACVGLIVLVCYPRFKKIQKLTDDLNNAMRETITGVRVIRAFNAEEYQSNKFGVTNKTVTENNLFTSRAMGVMMPVMTLCMSGLTLAIYWIAACLINQIPLTDPASAAERAQIIANMTAFTQYALQVVIAFMMLILIFILLPRSIVSARRINEVLDTKTSIVYPKENKHPRIRGEVTFKNVSFAYPDAQSPCLKNINFTIKPGTTFAIIGATGSGKSSIINLIPRFYDVSKGKILLDGENIKSFSQKDITDNISIATQKAILFRGDIKSNITYGSNQAIEDDDKHFRYAIKTAQANFVHRLKNGVRTEVAQGGTNFSGGQKQRLSIARAIYKNAPVLILDDAFSALDYKTDMLVRKGLKEYLKDTTIIIVAQRIGTIKNADQILVIDKGKMVGLGKHEKLLKTCKIYREIALSQLKESEL